MSEGRIVILSPHPDDEIIGCGGTIYMYHLKKAEITCIFMTDGRRGGEEYNEDELVSIRKEEAKNAANIIGIDRLVFLSNRDSELSPSSNNIAELTSILDKLRPDAIFIPFLMDNHNDHIATNQIFLSAINSLPSLLCYAYSVWTPLPFFNLNVDITPYVDIKRRALEEYRSQLKTYNFIDASLGLSKYYSLLSGGKRGEGWSEVYVVCSSKEYGRLAKAVDWYV